MSCKNKNGKPLYGTAAILHRMFTKEEDFDDSYDREAEMAECLRIIRENGYWSFDE